MILPVCPPCLQISRQRHGTTFLPLAHVPTFNVPAKRCRDTLDHFLRRSLCFSSSHGPLATGLFAFVQWLKGVGESAQSPVLGHHQALLTLIKNPTANGRALGVFQPRPVVALEGPRTARHDGWLMVRPPLRKGWRPGRSSPAALRACRAGGPPSKRPARTEDQCRPPIRFGPCQTVRRIARSLRR